MATTTPNYGLSKPAGTDPVDISVLNGNADIIDTALHELDEGKADQTALDELETEVGSKADQSALDALEAEVENTFPLTMALNDNVDDYRITESLTEHSGVRRWICPSLTVRNSLTGLPADFPAYPDFEVEFRQLKSNGVGVQSLYGGSLTTVYQARRFFKNDTFSAWYKVTMEVVP